MTPQQDAFQVTARRRQSAKAAPPAPLSPPALAFEKTEPRRASSALVWLALALMLLVLAQGVLVVVHVAAALACAALLEPFVAFCARRKMPRVWACLLALVLLGALVAALYYALAPSLVKDVSRMNLALNEAAPEKIASKLSILLLRAFAWLRTKSMLQQLQAGFEPAISACMRTGLALQVALLASVISYVIVAASAFYLLQWGERTRRKILRALPNRNLEMGALLLEKIPRRLGRYVRTHVVLALAMSLLFAAAFALLGLRGVFLMSVYAALTLLTPYWGALAAALPLVVVGVNATNSLQSVAGVVLALAVMQVLANIFLSSSRFKLEARLQPLEALLALLFGASLGGVWGLVLAGPLAGMCKIILKEAVEVRKRFRG